MIKDYLSKKEFPIRDFLMELEKKEVLFLYVLNAHNNEADILNLEEDSIEKLWKITKKKAKEDVKKLTKEELASRLSAEYEDLKLTSIIYGSLYQYFFEDENLFFNSKLLVIKKFISILFLKKTRTMLQDYLLKQSFKNGFSLDEFYKKFCFLNKPVLNTLGIISFIAQIDKAREELGDNFSYIAYEFRDYAMCLLFEQFEKIEEKHKKEQQEAYLRQERLFKQTQEQLSKREESLAKIKETNRKLTEEIQHLTDKLKEAQEKEKEIIDAQFVNQLYADLRKKDQKIEELTKELKNLREKPNHLYKTMIENLTNQIADLKRIQQEKSLELKKAKKMIEIMESKSIEEHLKEYLETEGFHENLYRLLEPYWEQYQKDHFLLQDKNDEVETEKEAPPEQNLGYCVIENHIHYVVFPDGSKLEIKNLPENIYLGQRQFVKVDKEGNFKYAFGYIFDENEKDDSIYSFGSVIYKENEPVMIKAVWDEQKIDGIPPTIQLRENQVIAVDAKGKFIRFYRPFHHNADIYMDSIMAKGQEAFYILKLFSNGMLVRNIYTEEEEFKVFQTTDKELKEQEIICVKENQIIKAFSSSKFYTLSTFYKKTEHGVAEIKNEMVFIRKLSGEVDIVNNIPEHFVIEEGDILKVDEFNNFLMVKKDNPQESDTIERKKLASNQNNHVSKKSYFQTIEIQKEVLIVGKLTYENSYKMTLYKKGYRAHVIDGYESWAKIKPALKDKHVVVVVTEFISHENMNRIKKCAEVPVIYSEFEGANRIVEQIEALDKKQDIV